jgi:hypothetical protein
LVTLKPRYLPQHPIFDHTQPMLSPSREGPSFTPTYNNSKITVLYILIFTFLLTNGKPKHSGICSYFPRARNSDFTCGAPKCLNFATFSDALFWLNLCSDCVLHSVQHTQAHSWFTLYCIASIRTILSYVILNTILHQHQRLDRGNPVGTATRYRLDGPGIESLWRRDFPQPSNPTPKPTEPPVQWVPRLFPGDKAAGAWR